MGGWGLGKYTYTAGYWDLLKGVCKKLEQLASRYADTGGLTNGVVRVKADGVGAVVLLA